MSDLPVDYGHDYDRGAIGWYTEKDGRKIIEFTDTSNITEDQINMIDGMIAPTYLITKVENGKVREVEIIGFSVVPKPRGAA